MTAESDCKINPPGGFQRAHAALVRSLVRGADAGAGGRLADDRLRRQHPDLRADRLRQDAERLPLGDRLARAAPGGARHRHQDRLRLAAEGALLRRRAQPARAAAGHRRRGLGRPADRRHAAEGAPGDEAHAARHPDHDPGVAVPDDHLAGARDPHRGRGGDRRRDPRRRASPSAAPTWRSPSSGSPHLVDRRGQPRPAADRPLRDPAPAGAHRASSSSAPSASARSSTPGSARTWTWRSSSRSTT